MRTDSPRWKPTTLREARAGLEVEISREARLGADAHERSTRFEVGDPRRAAAAYQRTAHEAAQPGLRSTLAYYRDLADRFPELLDEDLMKAAAAGRTKPGRKPAASVTQHWSETERDAAAAA